METPLLSKIPQTLTCSETDYTNAVYYKTPVSLLLSQKLATVSEMGHSDQRDEFQISIERRFLYQANNYELLIKILYGRATYLKRSNYMTYVLAYRFRNETTEISLGPFMVCLTTLPDKVSNYEGVCALNSFHHALNENELTVFTHKYVWKQIKVQQNSHKYYDTLQKNDCTMPT
jgi:hypothetical protein